MSKAPKTLDTTDNAKVKKKLRDARRKKKALTYEEFDKVFNLYDADRNGRLQYCEINHFMKDLLMRIKRTTKGQTKELSEKDMMAYSRKVQMLIEKYDVDRSGTLDRKEVADILNVKIPVETPYHLDTPVKLKSRLFERADEDNEDDLNNEDEDDIMNVLLNDELLQDIVEPDDLVPVKDDAGDTEDVVTGSSDIIPEEKEVGVIPKESLKRAQSFEDEPGNLLNPSRDIWQSVQKKTFTDWVDSTLRGNGSTYKVENLIENLGDGILLPELVSALLKKDINCRKNPKLTFHRYENIHICLDELKSQGSHFSMDVAGDLVSGNEKLCLSFMKTIINDFGTKTKSEPQLLEVLFKMKKTLPFPKPATSTLQPMPATQPEEPFLGQGNPARVKMKPTSVVAPQIKQSTGGIDLVTQVNKLLEDYDVKITNLTSDWTDGVVILILAERFCSGIYNSYEHDHALVKIGVSCMALNQLMEIDTEITTMDIHTARCIVSNFRYYLSLIVWKETSAYYMPFKRTRQIISKEKELRNVSIISESVTRRQSLIRRNTEELIMSVTPPESTETSAVEPIPPKPSRNTFSVNLAPEQPKEHHRKSSIGPEESLLSTIAPRQTVIVTSEEPKPVRTLHIAKVSPTVRPVEVVIEETLLSCIPQSSRARLRHAKLHTQTPRPLPSSKPSESTSWKPSEDRYADTTKPIPYTFNSPAPKRPIQHEHPKTNIPMYKQGDKSLQEHKPSETAPAPTPINRFVVKLKVDDADEDETNRPEATDSDKEENTSPDDEVAPSPNDHSQEDSVEDVSEELPDNADLDNDQEQKDIQHSKSISKLIANFIDAEETNVMGSGRDEPPEKKLKKRVRFVDEPAEVPTRDPTEVSEMETDETSPKRIENFLLLEADASTGKWNTNWDTEFDRIDVDTMVDNSLDNVLKQRRDDPPASAPQIVVKSPLNSDDEDDMGYFDVVVRRESEEEKRKSSRDEEEKNRSSLSSEEGASSGRNEQSVDNPRIHHMFYQHANIVRL